jgi:hypothetical protein
LSLICFPVLLGKKASISFAIVGFPIKRSSSWTMRSYRAWSRTCRILWRLGVERLSGPHSISSFLVTGCVYFYVGINLFARKTFDEISHIRNSLRLRLWGSGI